jgi:hypothetical protein
MRVNAIYAKEYSWVFEAFASNEGIQKINPKILRALIARTYDLVRHDIPKMTIQVDFTTLEHAVNNNGELGKILGITSISGPGDFNAVYPFTLSGVAERLNFTNWRYANQLITRVSEEKGVDLKSCDNQFHFGVKSGKNTIIHKYSQAAIDLLEKVKKNQKYDPTIKTITEKKK